VTSVLFVCQRAAAMATAIPCTIAVVEVSFAIRDIEVHTPVGFSNPFARSEQKRY
jgi:hypothetical protein